MLFPYFVLTLITFLLFSFIVNSKSLNFINKDFWHKYGGIFIHDSPFYNGPSTDKYELLFGPIRPEFFQSQIKRKKRKSKLLNGRVEHQIDVKSKLYWDMAPPKKINKESKKFQKGKKKKKKNKNNTTAPVDNTAVDCEWWDIFWKKNSPVSDVLPDEEEEFKHFFRVSKCTFEYICSLVKENLISRPPSGLINIEGRLLSVEKQVAIALRRLASGESQVSVGASFGVGQSTVSQVTWRFIEAMEERATHHLKWPDSNQTQRIKSGFEASSKLPNCCGAIDATHIVMTLPAVETSDDWCDQTNNYSMFVQGVVDSDSRFLDIVTGWPGGMPISRLMKFSGFYKLCESGERLNGNVGLLSDGEDIREYIVGGNSYPLLPWLITPFIGDDLSDSMLEFNRALETARSAAVKAFSELKGGWRILNKVMWRPDKRKLPSIILVCCLLHNIIIDCGDKLHPDVGLSGHHDSDYKGVICKQIDPVGNRIRENLAKHLLITKDKALCS